ncbi:MAG: OmpA family protein [Phycisphaerales bacterium]|nr:OmpA family protein [Phycisphaerales bacterium]
MDVARKLCMSLSLATGMLLLTASFAYAVSFGGGPATPTTGAASDVTVTSATLNGTVDSGGSYFSYYFEYGTTTAYGNATAITDYPAPVIVAVSAPIAGLGANTTYHYRLNAYVTGSPASLRNGADVTFTTTSDTAIAPENPTSSNLSPVAQIITWPTQRPGKRTAAYVLDGTTSYDGDGTVVSYSWLKGQRKIGTASTVQQKLPVGKTSRFTLIVTDDAGVTAQTSVSVTPPKGKRLKPIHIRLQAETLFLFDDYDLTSRAKTRLIAIVKRLHKLGVKRIKIDGYSDSLGTTAYNQTLSEDRAATVGKLLRTKLRLAASKVKERGYGESHPVAANANGDGSDNPDGRAKNRRVEVTAYFK